MMQYFYITLFIVTLSTVNSFAQNNNNFPKLELDPPMRCSTQTMVTSSVARLSDYYRPYYGLPDSIQITQFDMWYLPPGQDAISIQQNADAIPLPIGSFNFMSELGFKNILGTGTSGNIYRLPPFNMSGQPLAVALGWNEFDIRSLKFFTKDQEVQERGIDRVTIQVKGVANPQKFEFRGSRVNTYQIPAHTEGYWVFIEYKNDGIIKNYSIPFLPKTADSRIIDQEREKAFQEERK
ncbi:MAG: hypothetical protein MK212_08975 [Saprospiraceae bacterium]|nr:hypothetical protein [Saprospiraceae bacterium]